MGLSGSDARIPEWRYWIPRTDDDVRACADVVCSRPEIENIDGVRPQVRTELYLRWWRMNGGATSTNMVSLLENRFLPIGQRPRPVATSNILALKPASAERLWLMEGFNPRQLEAEDMALRTGVHGKQQHLLVDVLAIRRRNILQELVGPSFGRAFDLLFWHLSRLMDPNTRPLPVLYVEPAVMETAKLVHELGFDTRSRRVEVSQIFRLNLENVSHLAPETRRLHSQVTERITRCRNHSPP
jgi:hypothetical protein